MTAPNPTMPATGQLRRWLVGAGAALLLAGVAAAGWWWFRPPAATPPPIPAGIPDAEVQQAIADARQRVLDEPRSAYTWGRLGLVLLAHQFDREADTCFLQAAELAPTDPRWPYARGMVALKLGPDQALALFRQAAAVAESKPKYRFALRMRLAESLLEHGHLDEAENIFREEDKRQPVKARGRANKRPCS
jgi:tetratricopeptide (TPR) repeat protein